MNYTDIDINEIKNWLKENLSEEKYLHSLGSMEAAVELAEKFNLDAEKAKIAGLVHDCAKCLPEEELLDIMKNKCKTFEVCELVNPKTWHAPVSAYLAKNQFNIKDEEILSAVRWHTLGRVGMSDFEKIIFIADKIESKTRELTCCSKLSNLLDEENGIDKAMLECFKLTINSLLKRNLAICHQAIDVYNELLTSVNG